MLKNLVGDAMNYIKFNTPVEAADSFLIAVGFDNVRPGDSLVLIKRSGRQDQPTVSG